MITWPSKTNSRYWFLLLAWTTKGRGYWSWAVYLDARPRVWLMPWVFTRKYVRVGGMEYRNQLVRE